MKSFEELIPGDCLLITTLTTDCVTTVSKVTGSHFITPGGMAFDREDGHVVYEQDAKLVISVHAITPEQALKLKARREKGNARI